MPKPNIWGLSRVELKCEARTFTDPAQPGVELEITLQALDGVRVFEVGEKANAYIEEWVTGKDGPLPYPLKDGGKSLRFSEAFLQTVALLEAMEACADPDERYSLHDWAGLSVRMPIAFREISQWASSLFGAAADGDAGNPSAAVTESA